MYVYTQKLERALAELQKKVSHHPHPLLGFPSPVCSTTSLRSLSDRSDISSPVSGFADDDDVLLANAFGALSMHHYNKIDEFHGPTATSEVRNHTWMFFPHIFHCFLSSFSIFSGSIMGRLIPLRWQSMTSRNLN